MLLCPAIYYDCTYMPSSHISLNCMWTTQRAGLHQRIYIVPLATTFQAISSLGFIYTVLGCVPAGFPHAPPYTSDLAIQYIYVYTVSLYIDVTIKCTQVCRQEIAACKQKTYMRTCAHTHTRTHTHTHTREHTDIRYGLGTHMIMGTHKYIVSHTCIYLLHVCNECGI